MSSTATASPPRKVGILLWAGILLMPYLFCWFLLRRGHSIEQRLAGFGWLVMLAAITVATKHGVPPGAPATIAETAEHKANSTALPVDLARILNSLRDQDGVKWGSVMATRNGTTVCGRVNAHNVFGGYSGMRAFVFNEAVGERGVPAGGASLHWEGRSGFDREWRRLCVEDANTVRADGQSMAGLVQALAPTLRAGVQ